MNKAYANKKPKEQRPEGDFYSTPKSLVWVGKELIEREFPKDCVILEPCAGELAISQELEQLSYTVKTNDLFRGGVDYLEADFTEKFVITNPPFSLWDDFIEKAKTHCDKILFIGRLNYLGTKSRTKETTWKNLKSINVFNRYVHYSTPYRTDGLFHVGALCTGWFLWDMSYTGVPSVDILDVQPYAKLGTYKK